MIVITFRRVTGYFYLRIRWRGFGKIPAAGEKQREEGAGARVPGASYEYVCVKKYRPVSGILYCWTFVASVEPADWVVVV